MLIEVVICAVRNAPKFTPTEGEFIFEVRRRFGVEAKFFFVVVAEFEIFVFHTEVEQPFVAEVLPVCKPFEVGAGFAEEFELHLFKLADTENEVAGSDLVAETLADLSDAERHFLRVVRCTFLKFTKMPCAVSGRKYTVEVLSSVTPIKVLNIRLNFLTPVKSLLPHTGQGILCSAMYCSICSLVQPAMLSSMPCFAI